MPDIDGVARTLSARYYKDGSEILIRQKSKNPRKLTPRECARLQGYGDDFKIVVSDTQAYKQFGNSVVVPLVEEIAHCIVNTLTALDRNNMNSVLPVSLISQCDDLPARDTVDYSATAML